MTAGLTAAPLGKKSTYITEYQPDLLFPIPRKGKRDEMSIPISLPFVGHDVWNAFELSWLNLKGKPEVVLGRFIFPCESPNLIESKSFKLYLNSFNNTQLAGMAEVKTRLIKDLSAAAGAAVTVELIPLNEADLNITCLQSICLDALDIACDRYTPCIDYLTTTTENVEETLYSDLLKSNCLVTGQPDWATVEIGYVGKKINHAGLLKYIVSFRNHNEFHEQCVERIFMDITRQCQPQTLTVQARYTRRGGLDINPIRSSGPITDQYIRLVRQ